MDTRPLNRDLIRRLLAYNHLTGEFVWRPRKPDLFASGTGQRTPEQSCKNWNARHAGTPAMQIKHPKGYLYGHLFDKKVFAHRAAWIWFHGEEPDTIDHIDGCKWNNAISNLRNVSIAENQLNLSMNSRNTSGVRGVSWNRQRRKWVAMIKFRGKTYNLGGFADIDDAKAARLAAEKRLGFHANHGKLSPD